MSTTWFNELAISLKQLNKDLKLHSFTAKIAQHTIRVHFIKGSDFTQFSEAFYDTSFTDTRLSALDVYCLDAKTKKMLPAPPWPKKHIDAFGFVQGLEKTQFVMLNEQHNTLKLIDLEKKMALLYVDTIKTLPSWEFFSPLKEFIHFLGLQHRQILLHAGSLCRENQGTVFLAPGGTGKSTATVAGLASGLKSCGDDYVLACIKTNTIYCVYRTLKCAPNNILNSTIHLQHWPYKTDKSSGKKVYFIPEKNFLTPAAHINKIFILNRKDRPEINSISYPEALIQSAMNIIGQIPLQPQLTFQLLKQLLTQNEIEKISFGHGEASLKEALTMLFISNEIAI